MIYVGTRKYINKLVELLSKKGVEFNEYGKPYLINSELFFNKSHYKETSALIIDNVNCGIDIEQVREYNEIMAKKICSKAELIFLEKTESKGFFFTLLWVLKESYFKCIGTGINTSMKKISFIKNDKLELNHDKYVSKYVEYNKCIIATCKETEQFYENNFGK